MREAVNMSNKDLDRLHILKKVQTKQLTQVKAGELLKIGERQIRRLLVRLEELGPKGIVSKLVGKPGNRSKSKHFKQRVLALLREKYEDFGPTLAKEKLFSIEGLKVSSETIRKWMIESHLWIPRKTKSKQHLPRVRRACFGELIQADGSPHHWFGEEEPQASAIVLIDDATSIITGLFFSETETKEGYFKALEQHFHRYGRPRALYTDHYAVFCSPKQPGKTQMQMALKQLDIELILANSPQAKGRVERVNRTLQDRLTKEFRLKGIKTIDEANQYIAEYLEEHNKKFSKKPMSEFDAHRSLEGYDLERILCRKEERSLNSSGIFQFNKVFYQIQGVSQYRRLNKRKVEIRMIGAKMRVFLGNKELEVLRLDEIIEQPLELNGKEMKSWQPREYKVKATHPWKTGQTLENRAAML